MQDCKDYSGLQFIKFDLLTGGQEIKLDSLRNFDLSTVAVILSV